MLRELDGRLGGPSIRLSRRIASTDEAPEPLVEQPDQVGYRHQHDKDHREREEAQPAPFHPGCASSLAALTDLGLEPIPLLYSEEVGRDLVVHQVRREAREDDEG
jgi:hypothetical protein